MMRYHSTCGGVTCMECLHQGWKLQAWHSLHSYTPQKQARPGAWCMNTFHRVVANWTNTTSYICTVVKANIAVNVCHVTTILYNVFMCRPQTSQGALTFHLMLFANALFVDRHLVLWKHTQHTNSWKITNKIQTNRKEPHSMPFKTPLQNLFSAQVVIGV